VLSEAVLSHAVLVLETAGHAAERTAEQPIDYEQEHRLRLSTSTASLNSFDGRLYRFDPKID
jgi:hypothetical protein